MPKISKHTETIKSQKTARKFDYEVLYNQTHHFYILIPSEFLQVILLMSREEKESMNIVSEKQNKYNYAHGSGGYVVAQSSEYEAKESFKKAVSYLLDKTIVTRKVILIFYQKLGSRTYNSHRFNIEHDMIGSEFGITYAEEISIGTEKKYQFIKVRKAGDEVIDTTIVPFNIYDPATTVIEDTPENRAQVENLYFGLVTLYAKIKEVTGSEENLIKFIEGNTKLLLT